MVTLRANEEWRKDPARREAARQLCAVRANLLRNLIQALKDAQAISNRLHYKGYTDIPSLALHIEKLERSALHYTEPNETFIGNLAAFGEGTN